MDRTARVLAVALLLAAISWHGLRPIAGYDIWWQLALGREILATGGPLRTDPFSHTFAGQPWPYQDAGSAVVYHAVYALGGLAALVVLKTLIFAATMALFWRLLHARAVPFALRTALLATTIAAVAFRFTERPQIFSFAALLVALWILDGHRRGTRSVWWTVPLTIVNANLHRAALVLPLLVTGYVLALWWDRRRGEPVPALSAPRGIALVAANALGCLATPFGFDLVRTSFAMVRDPVLHGSIPEWWPATPTNLWEATPATALVLVLLIVGAIFGVRRRVLSAWDWALLVLAVGIGFRGVRFLPYLPLLGLPAVARSLTALGPVWTSPRRHAISIGAALTVLAAAMAAPLPAPRLGAAQDRYPKAAIRFIRDLPPHLALRGNMLNDFGLGGYIIHELGSKHPVFIDGRNDIVYPQPFIRTYIEALSDPKAFASLTDEHDIQWLFLDTRFDDPKRTFIDASGHWIPVFIDRAGVIYVRKNGINDPLARTHGYRLLRPYALSASLKQAAANEETRLIILAEAKRLVTDDPDSINAHIALARLYTLLGPSHQADLEHELTWLRDHGVDV